MTAKVKTQFTLTKEYIDQVFADAEHQSDALFTFYRLAFPQWDDIAKINGWPKIGKDASKYLWRKFIEFDQRVHPKVIAGGLWMNNGFSEDTTLDGWSVDSSECQLDYIEA